MIKPIGFFETQGSSAMKHVLQLNVATFCLREERDLLCYAGRKQHGLVVRSTESGDRQVPAVPFTYHQSSCPRPEMRLTASTLEGCGET